MRIVQEGKQQMLGPDRRMPQLSLYYCPAQQLFCRLAYDKPGRVFRRHTFLVVFLHICFKQHAQTLNVCPRLQQQVQSTVVAIPNNAKQQVFGRYNPTVQPVGLQPAAHKDFSYYRRKRKHFHHSVVHFLFFVQ